LKFARCGALVALFVVGLAALIITPRAQHVPATSTPSPTPQATVVEVIIDYGKIPYEQIIDNSDAIFVGRVLSISHTQWNQDQGEYWDGGLPVHFVELEVLQRLVDTIGLTQTVTLTQLDYSPLDERVNSYYYLEPGHRALFYIVQSELAWRGGLRTALRLTSIPRDSFVILGDDRYPARPTEEAARLERLIQDIAERRETLVQP
jgi:hypothetical protein